MATPKVEWYDIQEKVFTRWCNDYLSERGLFVKKLEEDLKNGLNLINLLEILSSKFVGRHNKHPTISYQKLENLCIALDFIKNEGITIVNIGAEDINMGNMRIILGLIWTLILRFEIQGGATDKNTASNALLEWVRSKIPEYNIQNFTKDWNDGRAVCALTNAMSPGLIPGHMGMNTDDKYNNANHGIDTAWRRLGVDPLIMPEEMNHPKVDKLAVMTYIAQFRNIQPKDLERSAASRCQAYGPGLEGGVAQEESPFTVLLPVDANKDDLVIIVEGPPDSAKVQVTTVEKGKNGSGAGEIQEFDVHYTPNSPGLYRVSVTLGGEHIPGSVFTVEVLENESLGGEGKIRVFFSTTSSSEKTKKDRYALENLLQAKKVHLREDFEPWHAVDLMEPKDRDKVFKKAGSKLLPMVFIDDQYVGDYDKLAELNESGELNGLLAMQGKSLVSESEHIARLKGLDAGGSNDVQQAMETINATAQLTQPTDGGSKFCSDCGTQRNGAKFCSNCGQKF